MKFAITEHVKVERIEAGIAVVTLRIPVELLDSLLLLADSLIHFARFTKTRSRVLLAHDRASSPEHVALLLASRAELARKESAKRASLRLASKQSKGAIE